MASGTTPPALPPIALTMGDPSGIGPEITAAAWRALAASGPAFYLIGDPDALPPDQAIREIASAEEATEAFPHALPVKPRRLAEPARQGVAQPANAEAIVEAIRNAVADAISGNAAGVVTNPINKKVLYDGAGFAFPGHTEFLAELGGVARSVMMIAGPSLRVVPVTIHIALSEVPRQLTRALILETAEITHWAMKRDFAMAAPRLAFAGLNPHAGESGAMGREEIDIIIPALEELRARGIDAIGPLPADTMFHAAARARYDVAITMYHDQGLIPVKALDFDQGVNVTLGLPFVRTSPDHGTAFDIAGKGIAKPDSLIAAIKLAARMAEARARAAPQAA